MNLYIYLYQLTTIIYLYIDCSTGFIQCPGDPNMTCVENSRGCDGVVDCPDGIDESAIACGQLKGDLNY